MGGILAPAATISGTELAPGIPLLGAPRSGLYELPGLNGAGFAVNQLSYCTLTALGVTFGNKPASSFAVSAITGSPFGTAGSGSSDIVIHPTLPFAFACGWFAGFIYTFSINPNNGVLTQTASLAPSSGVFGLSVSVDGLFLYANNGSTVQVFSINQSTGALTQQFSYAGAGAGDIHGLALSPDNKYVAVATQAATVLVYSRNLITGALTSVAGSPFNTGGTYSVAVCFSPDNSYLFVANNTSNNLSAFNFNNTNGNLAAISGSPFATGQHPSDVEVSPDGLHVFTVNTLDNNVSVFTISPSTGVLSQIASSPVAVGNTPIALAVSPDNLHVAVTNTSSATMSVFSRAPATGVLTPVVGSPFATPNGQPQGINFTVDSQFIYVGEGGVGVVKCVSGYSTVAFPSYNLLNAIFDPTGGLGGSFYINGNLFVNGGPVATFPATTGNSGKFLQLDTTGNTAWTPLNKYIPVAMVANAGAFTVDTNSEYIVEFTGVLTAQGTVTYTATITPLPTTVVFNNMTTGNFPLILNAGGFTIPAGISQWYWDGATLKQMFVAVTGITTIAAAATPDIFNAAGATISYDNTTPVTTTGFVACTLAQVGIPKKLIPVQNANFTASANLIIDGATSGTIVMPAEANIEVVPLTTSKFKITTIYAYASGSAAVSAGSGAFTTVAGSYTMVKVGRQITYRVKVAITTNGTAAGSVLVALPIANGADLRAVGTGQETAVTGASLLSIMAANSATMQITIESSGLYPGGNGYTLECQITMFV